jgi:hypothetical protein
LLLYRLSLLCCHRLSLLYCRIAYRCSVAVDLLYESEPHFLFIWLGARACQQQSSEAKVVYVPAKPPTQLDDMCRISASQQAARDEARVRSVTFATAVGSNPPPMSVADLAHDPSATMRMHTFAARPNSSDGLDF